jgi:SAM-dependent methyltransferase
VTTQPLPPDCQIRRLHSSLLNIRGDGKASLFQAVAYLCANVMNNARPVLPRRAHSNWSVIYPQQRGALRHLDDYWASVEPGLSPGRALSNFFWMTLPWPDIRRALGGEVHVLDVGCGSGGYFERLKRWSQGTIRSYRGVDLTERPEWSSISAAHPEASFSVIEAPFLASDVPSRTNLIITQSAIEHFEFDALFFCEVQKFVGRTSRPLLQVHLVPSAACLWLYIRHGYRQYTPYTIDKMTTCFSKDDTHKILVPLGGRYCNRLHFFAVTLSQLTRGCRADQRKTNPERYQSQLRTAILKDIQQPGRSPSFYAIVLASRLNLDLQRGYIS